MKTIDFTIKLILILLCFSGVTNGCCQKFPKAKVRVPSIKEKILPGVGGALSSFQRTYIQNINNGIDPFNKRGYHVPAFMKDSIWKRMLPTPYVAPNILRKSQSIFNQFDKISADSLYEYALTLYKNGIVDGAYYLFRLSSEKGYAKSQFTYGRLLVLGDGIKKDAKQGWQLIKKAAEQNLPIAMYSLGFEYYYNEYTEIFSKDTIIGLDLMRKAADENYILAQLKVGDIYFERADTSNCIKYYLLSNEHFGTGCQDLYDDDVWFSLGQANYRLGCFFYFGGESFRDVHKALIYWEYAGLLGIAEGAYNAGILMLNETDVVGNYQEGIKYMRMAGEKGYAGAQYWLVCHYYDVYDNDSTIIWGEKPGCKDSAIVQYYVGSAYYEKKDFKKAETWWKAAAEQNQPDACWMLSVLYDENTKDSVAFCKYLEKAVDLGYSIAMNDLGACYFNGEYYEKNEERGIEYMKTAAEKGSAQAYRNLGVIYYWKEYGRKNRKLAAAYWKRGAELEPELYGTAECQYYYGMVLMKGHGVKKDKEAGIHWLKLAAKNGSEEAKDELLESHVSIEHEPEVEQTPVENPKPVMKQYRVTGVDGFGVTLEEE